MGYLGIYKLGFKSAKRVHRPVVCIGNLVAGGSGKTPLTLAIAELLVQFGFDVVVSTSGYGSEKQHEASMAPGGELDVDVWGDESTMMRWLMPDLKLVVGRDRVRAGEIVASECPGAVMLMDDGFQHLPLQKDVAIVVDVEGLNRFCFPAGPYREPRGIGLRRADKVVRRGGDFDGEMVGFRGVNGEKRVLDGDVDALCAIGNPERFFEMIESQGLSICNRKVLTDHDPLMGEFLTALGVDRPLVVTAKDFVKLRVRQDLTGRDVVVADYRVRLMEPEVFGDWLQGRIDESLA
jgi:tetraacyldisaccharide 4'-kinase